MDNAVLQQILSELDAAYSEAVREIRAAAAERGTRYHYHRGFAMGIAQAIHVIRRHTDTEDQQREGVSA